MSSFPSSKSSFRRATQGCCALMLAGAMVLPMTPALAQDTAPVTNISVPNAPVANTASPVSQDVTDGPSFTIDYGEGAALYTACPFYTSPSQRDRPKTSQPSLA